jgi:hypothetical protein
VDLEAEVHNLEEDADAHEIERLTLLQNIAEMQQQVEEAEVLAGHSSFTAATSSAGTSRGAAGTVWSGPNDSGWTTVTDPTSFTCW